GTMLKRGIFVLIATVVAITLIAAAAPKRPAARSAAATKENWSTAVDRNAQSMFAEGKQIFRFETFGDEAFWSGTLQLHQAIEGDKHGGVGGGVSPKPALAVGLKVDAESVPADVAAGIKSGKVNLEDPATTLALLKLNAVVGVKGTFNADGS